MDTNFKEPLPTADFLACADTYYSDIIEYGSTEECDFCENRAAYFYAWNPPYEPFDMYICPDCLSTVKKGN